MHLFALARRFNQDVWYGDYSGIYIEFYQGVNNSTFLLELEKFLLSLEAVEREVLLLHFRYDLDPSEITYLLKLPNAEVGEL